MPSPLDALRLRDEPVPWEVNVKQEDGLIWVSLSFPSL